MGTPRSSALLVTAALTVSCGSKGSSVPTHQISGTLTGGAGATVTVSGAAIATSTADSSGRFVVTGLRDGSYTVTPTRASTRFVPPSAAVDLRGADSGGVDFTAVATGHVSGTIGGPVVAGIPLELKGPGGTRSTVTLPDGTFSFDPVPDGAWVLTPSSPPVGTSYLVFLPARLALSIASNDVTGITFSASYATAPFFLSGTVSYSGARTGRIYVSCGDGLHGTSIPGPGPYLIRGFTFSTTCTPSAWLDTQGLGTPHAVDPVGAGAPTPVGNGNAVGADVTLVDPAAVAPGASPGIFAVPLDGGAIIGWDISAATREPATSYRLSWGTDPAASSGGSRIVPANGEGMAIVAGLANGRGWYFKLASRVDASEGPAGPVLGPVAVGPASGGSTVTGVVTFPGPAGGPLTVLVAPPGPFGGSMKGVVIPAPVSPQPFTVHGVPVGDATIFALLDNDGNGVFTEGDLANYRWDISGMLGSPIYPSFNVAGDTAQSLDLPGRDVTLRIVSRGSRNGAVTAWGGAAYLFGERRRPVAVTLTGGPFGADVPTDLDFTQTVQSYFLSGYHEAVFGLDSPPTTGGTYHFDVTWSDGSFQEISGTLDRLLDFPGSPAADPSPPGSATVPNITWLPPATTPPGTWGTFVNFIGTWFYPRTSLIPPAQTSVLFDADGTASGPLIPGASYSWVIGTKDELGDYALVYGLTYTP